MDTGHGSRVFITGAHGMIGRACATALHHAGWQICATDAKQTSKSYSYMFKPVDLRNRKKLSDMMVRCSPELVIHAGGFSGPMQAVDKPSALVDVNVMGLIHTLDAARQAKTRKFIWFSSILAYGTQPNHRVVRLDTHLQPDTLYGATKVAGECLLKTYASLYDMDVTVFRPSGVYGPGRTTVCLIRTLLEHGLNNRTLVLNPAPKLLRQFIYIDDVVQAIIAALRAPCTSNFRVYNLADGHGRNTYEIVDLARTLLPTLTVRYDEHEPTISGFPMGVLDTHNTREELAWQARTSLHEGMGRYLDFLRQTGRMT